MAPRTLKPNVLENNRKCIYDHIIPVIGRDKLKNINPPMLDVLFADLQRSGNKERTYRLKDRALLDGFKRDEFAEKTGVSRSIVFSALRQDDLRRENAEKIAQALGKKIEDTFDEATKKKGLSG